MLYLGKGRPDMAERGVCVFYCKSVPWWGRGLLSRPLTPTKAIAAG